MTNYSFVLDARGKPLSPTKAVKAWYMIRKGKAILVSKYPMVIQLKRVISTEAVCKDEIRCGIDDGGLHTGIALIQRCQAKNKVLFKGTIEQRNDVKHLIDVRRGYRRYHRYNKRHRPARFNNRKVSCRKGRVAPSILQKRQAKRLNGSNTLNNLITLCHHCHHKTQGREEQYMQHYFNMLGFSDDKSLNYASHVMIGKQWLRAQLSTLGPLHLTNGGDTANKRIDWDVEKTHANDAICITGLKPSTTDVKEWMIKPMRRKSKAKTESVLGIRHRDLVEYTYKNGETYRGYVTALYPKLNALNFQSPTKHCKKVNVKKCRLIWKYSKIYWLDNIA